MVAIRACDNLYTVSTGCWLDIPFDVIALIVARLTVTSLAPIPVCGNLNTGLTDCGIIDPHDGDDHGCDTLDSVGLDCAGCDSGIFESDIFDAG